MDKAVIHSFYAPYEEPPIHTAIHYHSDGQSFNSHSLYAPREGPPIHTAIHYHSDGQSLNLHSLYAPHEGPNLLQAVPLLLQACPRLAAEEVLVGLYCPPSLWRWCQLCDPGRFNHAGNVCRERGGGGRGRWKPGAVKQAMSDLSERTTGLTSVPELVS